MRLYVTQDTPDSGGLAVTRDQVLEYFEQQTKGKGGVRDKVSEVLDRMCEGGQGGRKRVAHMEALDFR
jgi:3-hydroxyacyl-CoA dehydrogenase